MDKEDLEALWSLVKRIFSTAKPKNFSNDFLLTTLGAMFEKPDAHAQSESIKEVYIVKQRCTCSNLEESKKCTWSSKGQELEATRIMWCADHNFYNHTADFVSGKEEESEVSLNTSSIKLKNKTWIRLVEQKWKLDV
nr:hypothetical protein [Tanacetum cinerariifolium]